MTELTTTYQQVKKFKPRNLREVAREAVLNGLSLKTKLPYSKRVFTKPRIQFLYIHHVFEDEVEPFDKLIARLSIDHSFISYSEAVKKLLSGNIDKPYISISSDDGFKNNLAAAAVLDKYGIKGCFFINPDTIGMNKHSEIQMFCKNRLHFPPTEFMNWNDVNELMKNGHEIGSHTIGHIKISETAIEEVRENLGQSYEEIKKQCGDVVHFAYPYGRYFHFNKEAYQAVFDAGYMSCASAERGCHISSDKTLQPNELFIRRDHVICDWNMNHILYFILNNAENLSVKTNAIPYV